MAITLTWRTKGSGVTNHKIYRGTQADNLTVLATVSSAATSYTDNTALNNTLYYYQVNAVVGGLDEVPGAILPYASVPDSGPGPQTLVAGDMNWGYFGSVTTADFISESTIKSAINVLTDSTMSISSWYKMAYQGKILFIPNTPIKQFTGTLINMAKALYNGGFYLGNNKNELPNPALGISVPVPQDKKITVGSYEFYIRAPRGQETTPQAEYGTTSAVVNNPARESIRSEASMIAAFNPGWLPMPTLLVTGLTPPKLTGNNKAVSYNNNGYFITQHWTAISTALIGNLAATNATTAVATSSGTASTTYNFVPVLELIV